MDSFTEKRKFSNLSSRISNGIAAKFYKLGFLIASHPWKTVMISFLVVGVCSIGFIRFELETNPLELWVPRGSKFLEVTKWILNRIDYGFRAQNVLIVAPNVLDPKILQKLTKIHWSIVEAKGELRNGSLIYWDDVCLKIPFITGAASLSRKQRDTPNFDDDTFSELFAEADNIRKKPSREFNPSVDLNPAIYCNFINNLPLGCYEKNILELWEYDIRKVEKLTLANVSESLKGTTISPVTGHETDYWELLGGIQKDQSGRIISANALMTTWFVYLNFSEVKNKKIGNLAGTETWTTEQTAAWEDSFLEKMEYLKQELETNDTKIYYSAAKSFGDISYATMFQETDKLLLGITLMFIYIQIVLSKFSCTELRVIENILNNN